ACEKKAGRVSSLSLVRYRGTEYSVPTAYGHREVLIRGYVHEVVISCGAEVIARHPRSYEREDFVFDPLHYLPLLEQKIGALDQAAPLVGWDLPEEFATLRRLIEARMTKRGKREFVQVLRLLEVFRPEDVLAGIREAIARGAIGFDAVTLPFSPFSEPFQEALGADHELLVGLLDHSLPALVHPLIGSPAHP